MKPELEHDKNDSRIVSTWVKITRKLSIPEYIEGTAKRKIKYINSALHEYTEITFREYRVAIDANEHHFQHSVWKTSEPAN